MSEKEMQALEEEDEETPSPAPAPEIAAAAAALTGKQSAGKEQAAGPAESFDLDGRNRKKCGSFNRGHTCSACGAEKPKDAVQYVCDRCGWTNPDPEHPPRFCPDCGAPFAAADDQKG